MSKRTDKIEEMFKLVSELESGDYDRQSFARLHGMSVSKLDYWRHRFHRQNQIVSGFVELKTVGQESSILITYPNGVTIRLNGQPDPIRLRELVTLL